MMTHKLGKPRFPFDKSPAHQNLTPLQLNGRERHNMNSLAPEINNHQSGNQNIVSGIILAMLYPYGHVTSHSITYSLKEQADGLVR